ncbi:MAG: hypothetical protein ABIR35_08505 [Polaromonas sp.]
MTRSGPPRFVPTLTEIVHAQLPLQTPPVAASAAPETHFPEAMAQRILQRVDLVLETRLRDSVTRLVLQQTQALIPLLREEIEQLVRESVSQAFAQETGSAQEQPEDRVRT